LDGTLVDSDDALVEPFIRMGVRREDVHFGRLLADECAAHGVTVEEYLALYDASAARPFDGVDDLLRDVGPWALCSHKARISGMAELARLGWEPVVALFAEDFGPAGKRLEPVLGALGLPGTDVVFVGDTAHDRSCAHDAGAAFALAGWNPRAIPVTGDLVAATPADVLALLRS
jgi:phosphoglycolate phosphatase-like HAD superfamily hydrolase